LFRKAGVKRWLLHSLLLNDESTLVRLKMMEQSARLGTACTVPCSRFPITSSLGTCPLRAL
jgi:hypothetical protein